MVASARMRPALVALAAVAAASAARAAPARPARRPDVVALRYAWPDPLEARVTYRRTSARPGAPGTTFAAQWSTRATRERGTVRIATRNTSWSGDLPFPPGFADQALRASEQVVERVDRRGAFAGLEGVEAMRPVLAKIFALAEVPKDRAERAVALAEAAMRAETEELWNLQAGFWTGAKLELGETYTLSADAAVPLVPGARARQEVRFSARRRVPCAAGEDELRCVELTLRAIPDADALSGAKAAAVAALGDAAGVVPSAVREVGAEAEALVVTEPATLVPHRLVWTKRLHVAWTTDEGLAAAEREDRSEYEWRYAAEPGAPSL